MSQYDVSRIHGLRRTDVLFRLFQPVIQFLASVNRAAFREYLPDIGMADLAPAAARIVHYTGYEMPVRRIRAPGPVYHTLGCLVACADLQAQMADRCYLEKCYARLYVEFLLGGVARRIDANGREEVVYASAADLLRRTPQFIEGARRRLAEELDGHDRFMAVHFGGTNPYRDGSTSTSRTRGSCATITTWRGCVAGPRARWRGRVSCR